MHGSELKLPWKIHVSRFLIVFKTSFGDKPLTYVDDMKEVVHTIQRKRKLFNQTLSWIKYAVNMVLE